VLNNVLVNVNNFSKVQHLSSFEPVMKISLSAISLLNFRANIALA